MQKTDNIQESIYNHLTLRYDPNSKTTYKHKSWQDFVPLYSDELGISTERRLHDAIVRKLESYETIIIPLSSGVDSPLLLMLIRETFPDKEIICINHIGLHDEYNEAQRYADMFDAVMIKIKSNEIIENIPKMVKITNEPRWNAYQFELFEHARDYLIHGDKPIIVTGDGADELFGGYVFRYKQFTDHEIAHENLMVYSYLNCHRNDWVDDQYEMFNNTPCSFHFYNILQPMFENHVHPLNRVMLADYNGKLLHDFLTTADSLSRYYQIPVYAPYMELNNFATHIPWEEKITIDRELVIGKKILRNIGDRWGLKLTQKKIPYSVDIITDFKKHEDFLEKFLLDKDRKIYQYINYKWVDESFGVDYDYRYVNKWLQLYALECWLNEQ